jgi:hypothetical protein
MNHALVAVRRGRRHVALLLLRRPIRDKPSGCLRFAALAAKPGEKCGLVLRQDADLPRPSTGHRCDPISQELVQANASLRG